MKTKLILNLLCLFTFTEIYAHIQDHLKKADNKSCSHSIPEIDFIYMINLDQRPEKFKKSIEQLAPYGINPYRFSAVNGWELSIEDVNDVGIKFKPGMPLDLMGTTYLIDGKWEPIHEFMHNSNHTYFCHCMARGPIGIYLSHLSILKDAYDSGYETIWVMEDDIYVCKNPNEISLAITTLNKLEGKNGWDILFTDRDTRNQQGKYVPCLGYARRPNFIPENRKNASIRKVIGSNLRLIGARYGAYSMIVNRSGMKKILDFAFKYKIFLPFDMDMPLVPNLKMYTVLDDIVSTLHNAISDNGGPNYN